MKNAIGLCLNIALILPHSFHSLMIPRELFLSRKYGVIWGEKVFGRVLPSAARRHCDRRLKRQSMTVWTQTWWRARREWKLNIRADCHNRQVCVVFIKNDVCRNPAFIDVQNFMV